MRILTYCSSSVVAVMMMSAGSVVLADSDPQAPGDTYLLRAEEAQGWQIYACVDGALTFSRPYAGLSGEIVHFGPGPFWETYGDQGFSRIRGGGAVAFPNDNPGENIPDLLLNVVSSEGDGPLAGAVNIIRRNSRGGTAAVGSACENDSDEIWVPYTATYEFYARW
jgi:Protein of unknown function (DUF3455)